MIFLSYTDYSQIYILLKIHHSIILLTQYINQFEICIKYYDFYS